MKLLSVIVLSLFLGLSAEAQTNAQITLWWNEPANCLTPDAGFVIYTTPILGPPLSNWTVLTNLSVTNMVTTNLDATGTNAVLSLAQQIQIGQHFFVLQASNMWGLSTTSNVASTPPAPPTNGFTRITHP
jgi:hypothetical protein